MFPGSVETAWLRVGPILERAGEESPQPLTTLDGLSLASLLFLAGQGPQVTLAGHDRRLTALVEAAGAPLYPL